jgi:hypothetical protein
METIDIITRLSTLSRKYHSVQQELRTKYQFNEVRDVRINIFKHCYFVIDGTYVFFLIRYQNMFTEAWWNGLINANLISEALNEQQRNLFIYGFDSFVISSYFVMLLFAIESGFRSIYQAVFSRNAPFHFHDVYVELLEKSNLEDYIDLLNVSTSIRNSLHNGNVHIKGDEAVIWRCKLFLFRKNEIVDLGDAWRTLTDLTDDIHEMLEKLIKEPRILSKPGIIDASYNNIV